MGVPNENLITFCTDCNGNMKYIKFLFKETPYLNVEEVKKLEARLLDYKFDMSKIKTFTMLFMLINKEVF